jgi:hypothetical protein
MKDLTRKLFNTGDEAIEREVDEELRFHLDLLTEQHLQDADTVADARAAALSRFGDVEQIKDECVEISKRSRPLVRALKTFFVLTFLAGILVRIFGTELHVDRVGQMLIAIGFMGRLFMYVRGSRPAGLLPKSDTPLRLNSTATKSANLPAPASLFDADNL